ncbi:MAG: esterase [Bryobacterales bacterium]|nr:esterase [Bryobacterales bacterium]
MKIERLLLLILTTQIPALSQPKVMTWIVEGVKREAIVYAPLSKSSRAPVPVVLAFHGHGDTADNYQGVGIHENWAQAVVVYPKGLDSARDGAPGWQVEKGKDGDRDLKLVDQMLAALRKQFSVDDSRIYATGFSNGANFTYLLWAERPRVFAAYAPVAARILPSVHLTEPKPVLHVGGTADRQILFADQREAIEAAKRANGAAGKGSACGPHCTLYESSTGAPVMTVIHPGGHTYPQDTSRSIVEFFKKHSLAAPSR